MQAPILQRQANAINSHQYLHNLLGTGLPYKCMLCDTMVYADKEGLVCPNCGDRTTTFPWVDKMFSKEDRAARKAAAQAAGQTEPE